MSKASSNACGTFLPVQLVWQRRLTPILWWHARRDMKDTNAKGLVSNVKGRMGAFLRTKTVRATHPHNASNRVRCRDHVCAPAMPCQFVHIHKEYLISHGHSRKKPEGRPSRGSAVGPKRM